MMKSRLLIIIVLTLALTSKSFPQYNLRETLSASDNSRLVSMPYSNSGGEEGITIFEYESDGKLSRSFWTLLDSTRSSLNYYTYDNSGNIISKYREFSDKLTSTEIFEYDTLNRLISENFRRSDGVSSSVKYIYNEVGRIESATWQDFHGWFTGVMKYIHSAEGELTGANILQDGKQIGTVEFSYDIHGRLVKEHWIFQGSYSQTFKYEYSNGNLVYPSSNVFIKNNGNYIISGEEYDFNGESGGPSEYFYSHKGKLERKTFHVNGKLRTETTYQYNEDGILKSSHRLLNDGSENFFVYKFNENRQLISRLNYLGDSIIGEEYYSYKNGLLVRGIYKNFDYWLSGSLTFEHDNEGKLTKGFFKGEEGWDADIIFTYDKDKNLSMIHWKFSFGKTQTYRFQYKKLKK